MLAVNYPLRTVRIVKLHEPARTDQKDMGQLFVLLSPKLLDESFAGLPVANIGSSESGN